MTDKPSANPGYLAGLIDRALATARANPDAAVRTRAEEKARRYERALRAMLDGEVSAGSRTPVIDTPAWATLEVVKGGFATGNLLANGPLQPHEIATLERMAVSPGERARAVLNAAHTGGDGLAELQARLRDGRYRVEVPEEGALLVVAWLFARGEVDRAYALLDEIVAWFDRLRFYPVPAEKARPASALVKLQPVSDTVAALKNTTPQKQVSRMNETLRVWSPFEDRLVALVWETVEGDGPRVIVNRVEGKGEVLARNARGGVAVAGGEPFKRSPEGWAARATALLAEFAALKKAHTLCLRATHPKGNLARLVAWVTTAVQAPAKLTARDRGAARTTLAVIAHKRGLPGSSELSELRRAQSVVATAPTRVEFARIVARRLAALPGDGGVASVEEFFEPVRDEEARAVGVASGVAIPRTLEPKLLRSLEAPIEDLVARGVIPSGEVLAVVTPQITAQVRASGVTDPALRRVYESVYTAFRKRRSLLLLDLQHQVRIEELPWVAAIERERRQGIGADAASLQTLERLASLALQSYPHAIVPNKLVTELASLMNGAKVYLPLVEEVAADIFMGTFTVKFLRAAKYAARLLKGSLYERYYGLPFDRVLAMSDEEPAKVKSRWLTGASQGVPEFVALCNELASRGRGGAQGAWVAQNGTVIEQEQILTTHNLAVLWTLKGVSEALTPEASELARRVFAWVCDQYAQRVDDGHARLLRLKNTAYAWRQMVFFLSVDERAETSQFMAWAESELAHRGDVLPKGLAQALAGLRQVSEGHAFDDAGLGMKGARRFLGWTLGRHWLSE